MTCSCEHGIEPSSYVTGEEFFDQLSDYHVISYKDGHRVKQ